jgi:putative spermidine/putrescine transport system permease protein
MMGRILPTTVVGLILLFLVLPIVVVMVVSFSSATYLTFPPPAFGLKWYEAYFSSADWLRPTWLSIWVATVVVALSTVLGTLAALGITRLPKALRIVVAGLVLSPLIVPGIVVAIGIYYAFSRYGLVGSPVGLILAHTCLSVPFVVTSVSASLAGIDPRLGHAALSLGATPRATFFQVTLPLIRPGVLVGALFAFIHSFDELIVALFISGSGAVTLPRRMWDDLRFAIDPTIAAVSTLTIVLTAALMWGAHLLRKHAERRATPVARPQRQTSQPWPAALVKSSCTIRSLKSRSPPPKVSSHPQVFKP